LCCRNKGAKSDIIRESPCIKLLSRRTFEDILFQKNVLLVNRIYIQGVSEIGTLILTGNRTRQKEQLFYLPFCRKTMFNSKKKLEKFFTKIALRH
jgi:hypothetical protein